MAKKILKKKVAVSKTATKKVAAKRPPTKKAAAKKPVSKKAPAKKAVPKSVSKPIPNLRGEVWKKIIVSEKPYWVSNLGRVKSFYYDKENGKILKGKKVNGYMAIDIVNGGIRKMYYIHHLIAKGWCKKTPKQTVVMHMDWNKLNNAAKNLKWAIPEEAFKRTAQQNQKLIKSELRKSLNAKLNRNQVVQIKKSLKRGVRQIELATKFKISEMQISRIARGQSWNYIKI